LTGDGSGVDWFPVSFNGDFQCRASRFLFMATAASSIPFTDVEVHV